MIVKEIMTENPVTAEYSDSVSSVLETLNELDIRHIPVVESGVLKGLLSDRDLRSFNLPGLVERMNPDKAAKRLEAPISSIMNSDVFSVGVETDITEVIQLMIDHKYGAIPVTDELEGKLVGIVSYIDVLRAAEDLF